MTTAAITAIDWDKQQVQRFLQAIRPWRDLYTRCFISFLALKEAEGPTLVDAKVVMAVPWNETAQARGFFETERLIVGQVFLQDVGVSLESLLESIHSGTLTIGRYRLRFPLETNGSANPYFVDYDQELAATGRRGALLRLSGLRWAQGLNKTELDWHLRSHAFDSLDELTAEFGVGTIQLNAPTLEVRTGTVVEALTSAQVKGTWAHPTLVTPVGGHRDRFSLAYRVFSSGKIQERRVIPGNELVWAKKGEQWHGRAKIKVKHGSAVHCFAAYEGVTQHHVWIGDLSASPNFRHAIFAEVDPELEVIRDYLFEEKKMRKEARDFEVAVCWLLWMWGFSVLNPATKRLEDNVDLIAVSPTNKILLVECTTGMLSKEGKTSTLLQRTAAMKKRLKEAGFGHLLLLPLGITARPRDELGLEIAEASRAGVVLLTRDDLQTGLARSAAPTDADSFWNQVNEEARRRMSSPTLPVT